MRFAKARGTDPRTPFEIKVYGKMIKHELPLLPTHPAGDSEAIDLTDNLFDYITKMA
jgi:hypothetical protein